MLATLPSFSSNILPFLTSVLLDPRTGLLAKMSTGPPFVVTDHGLQASGAPPAITRWMQRRDLHLVDEMRAALLQIESSPYITTFIQNSQTPSLVDAWRRDPSVPFPGPRSHTSAHAVFCIVAQLLLDMDAEQRYDASNLVSILHFYAFLAFRASFGLEDPEFVPFFSHIRDGTAQRVADIYIARLHGPEFKRRFIVAGGAGGNPAGGNPPRPPMGANLSPNPSSSGGVQQDPMGGRGGFPPVGLPPAIPPEQAFEDGIDTMDKFWGAMRPLIAAMLDAAAVHEKLGGFMYYNGQFYARPGAEPFSAAPRPPYACAEFQVGVLLRDMILCLESHAVPVSSNYKKMANDILTGNVLNTPARLECLLRVGGHPPPPPEVVVRPPPDEKEDAEPEDWDLQSGGLQGAFQPDEKEDAEPEDWDLQSGGLQGAFQPDDADRLNEVWAERPPWDPQQQVDIRDDSQFLRGWALSREPVQDVQGWDPWEESE